MNIHPVGDELFLADGQTNTQTDVTQQKVPFLSFVDAPKNSTIFCSSRLFDRNVTNVCLVLFGVMVLVDAL